MAVATLGDDSVKVTCVLEQLGGAAIEQVTALFRSALPARFPRGNVSGDVVFTCATKHASLATAASYYKTEYGRINQQGTLVLTIGATTMTFALATMRGVTVASLTGVRWVLRYTVGVKGMS